MTKLAREEELRRGAVGADEDQPALPTADLVAFAALVADPARARMLTALMSGLALTATELSMEAGIAPSTASSHLARLATGGVIALERHGRHRYYRLAGPEVAAVLETIGGGVAHPSTRRFGPADPALRRARVCYDHLAGEWGVRMLTALRRAAFLGGPDGHHVTPEGERFFARFGLDLPALARSRRVFARACLDWTERRHHLGGALGAAILDRIFALGWARRSLDGRALLMSQHGERALREWLGETAEAGDDLAGSRLRESPAPAVPLRRL